LHSLAARKPDGNSNCLLPARGFAFLAYPTEYRSLSAMTFIVARGSVVYEKNLGRRTAEIAKAMTSYDRDST